MKKRILTVLISIITVIPLVLITPKAEVQTSTHTITSYGDYTFQQGMSTTTFNYELPGLPINLTWNSGSYMKLDYNFKDKYSGSMKLTVTSNQDWVLNSSPVYWSVSGDGDEAVCYISATTTMSVTGKTKTFSIIFDNCTGIHFSVATGSSATFFTSNNSITISNATFTSQADLNTLYLDIRNFHNSWDFYIPDMSTNLSNIASNTATMASDIAILKGYIDNIEPLLDSIYSSLNSHDINGLRIRLNQNTSGYTSQMFEYPTYSDNYFKTDINNLDVIRIGVAFNEVIRNGNYLLMQFYLRSSSTIPADFDSNFRFGSRDITGNVRTISNIYKVVSKFGSNTLFMSVYVPLDSIYMYGNTSEYLYDFDIQGIIIPSMSLFGFTSLGVVNNLPYDDDYLSLLESINNGISDLGSEYDTSEYQQYEQVVDNLNDSLLIDVNNSKDSILTDISNQSGSSSELHLNNVRIVINGLFNDIFTIYPPLKYLVVVGLILLVLGVIL